MKLYHIVASLGFCLILTPWAIIFYKDHRDIKKIESIQWDITTGGDGMYTSKDGQYQLYVRHPYPESIGSSGDSDGDLIFYYLGGSNYISNPPFETMQIFKKR